MPRLSALARGCGSWDGDLEQAKEVALKGITKPILPQYLSSEDQPFYKQKTVKFPIRTKTNHIVIKTIIAEAERIKSAKNRKHDDPPTVAEEIQSNVPMTQPSREQSSPSQRWKSRPEFRTNHRPARHLRTRSALAGTKFTIKPNGEMQLPKTYITRKGAMVLFTAPSKIKFTKEGRCFTSNRKTKKDISNLSLSLGTIRKLCSSVLEYGEQMWSDDDIDSLASQQFHKTCMRFIRDQEGQECVDYRVQPGSDFNFYLNDIQKRASVRNSTRCGSPHSLTSTEAAEELNEAYDNVDADHKPDGSNGKPDLITADAHRLAESMSGLSTSTSEWNHQYREAFSRPSTTQNLERKFANADRMTRLGSDRSMSPSRTSTPLSCAKLTASLKSANYLGRGIITPHSMPSEAGDSKLEEGEVVDVSGEVDDEAGRDVKLSRQQSVISDRSVKSGSRPRSAGTDGTGDAGNGSCVLDDESVGEFDQEDSEDNKDVYDDVMSVEISLRGSRRQSTEHNVAQMDDLVETPDGRSSQMSRRSRRSSAQRSKTPCSTTSRRSSVKIDSESLGDEEQTMLPDNGEDPALSIISSNGEQLEIDENEEIQNNCVADDVEEREGMLPSTASIVESEGLPAADADNSAAPTDPVISRPLTSGSSRHSVRSFHCPTSGSSVLESSVDFNDEQLQSIYGLDEDERPLQHGGTVDGQVINSDQIGTDRQTTTDLTECSATIEESLGKTKNRQSVKSASSKSEASEYTTQSPRHSLLSLTSLPPDGVPEREASASDGEIQVKAPSVKGEEQTKFIKISEPLPPPPRIPSGKISPPNAPVDAKQSFGMTPKPPATKVTSSQPPATSILKKVVTPIPENRKPASVTATNRKTSSPTQSLDLFSLKSITNKQKPTAVKKKNVIGGPQFNDGLLKETYEEPGADEIEKMIQEELEKDLKEHGLIEMSESGDATSAGNMNQKKSPVNFDTDEETISKEVKDSNKGKKKSKKQILKEREELRESRRREKKLKEEEAKALKAKKKAAEEEKRKAEEDARREKMKMEEEMQDALLEAEAAKEAEEQARLMLQESRKQAREERDAKRKAEMERKKEERNRQREERKKMEEAAKKREQDMKDKLASVEDIIRQKELEREMEWEREEKEREEREELERLDEEEKQRIEDEEARIRELEKEAEEEAIGRLVKERKEAEQRMKIAEIEAQKQREKEKQIRLEKQRRREQEAEERRLQELEKERLREIERQRIMQIKKVEEEARSRVLKKLEGQRIWAMRRRDANMERFAHLNSVRRTQGTTRPWVFSYYVHWPRQTYEKRLATAKKKQRRPTKPKPPAEPSVETAS